MNCLPLIFTGLSAVNVENSGNEKEYSVKFYLYTVINRKSYRLNNRNDCTRV